MNTFERYLPRLDGFIDRILAEKPKYVIPVAKKGAKLLRLSNRIPPNLVRFLDFFRLQPVDVRGARVAVVDDASQHTSGLKEHRRFFERLGADVSTFAFVGHAQLFEGRRWMYDTQAHVEVYLPDAVYQEYILQQSRYLLVGANHFDIDHLVAEIPFAVEGLSRLKNELAQIGSLLPAANADATEPIDRFSLDARRSFDAVPFFNHPSVKIGNLRKLKLAYVPQRETLALTPLVFPVWVSRLGRPTARDFAEVPFTLPLDPRFGTRLVGRGGNLATYHNICALYQAVFLKFVLQRVPQLQALSNKLSFRRADLASLLGDAAAEAYLESVRSFIDSGPPVEIARPSTPVVRNVRRSARDRFRDFAHVVDHLKDGYRRALKTRKKRIGVHYYVSADKLFNKYQDSIDLSTKIDHYCDLGVIVAGTVEQSGTWARAFRSGEPDGDYDWKRTQVLVPLAISQFELELGDQRQKMAPTVLNKLLGTFQFDYPRDAYRELHCLIGEPYRFGTFIRAYHQLRAPSRPSLYEAKKISPFYTYNKDTGTFAVHNIPAMNRQLATYFHDRQEVGFAEIVSYLRFLIQAYRLRQQVDVLNALSICREEQYFYSHILHNLRECASILALSMDARRALVSPRSGVFAPSASPSRTRKFVGDLTDARDQALSATEKLRLAREFPQLLSSIIGPLGKRPEFVTVIERIESHHTPFSARFQAELPALADICALCAALSQVWLCAETKEVKYAREFIALQVHEALQRLGVSFPSDLASIDPGSRDGQDLFQHVLSTIDSKMRLLPSEEPLLESRVRAEERDRARNKAAAYAYDYQLDEICILYADFTGLRRVPEPKETVVALYYNAARQAGGLRGGRLLYGGNGGDDAFAWAFTSAEHAFRCAQDIKKVFSSDLFLREYDVKFGLSVAALGESKEEAVIACWGNAKDCCEFKSATFRNRGHLIVSQATLDGLGAAGLSGGMFTPVAGEHLSDAAASPIYAIEGVAPLA